MGPRGLANLDAELEQFAVDVRTPRDARRFESGADRGIEPDSDAVESNQISGREWLPPSTNHKKRFFRDQRQKCPRFCFRSA